MYEGVEKWQCEEDMKRKESRVERKRQSECGEESFVCNFYGCGTLFRTHRGLCTHVRQKHKREEAEERDILVCCPHVECERVFRSQKSLSAHIWQKHEKREREVEKSREKRRKKK